MIRSRALLGGLLSTSLFGVGPGFASEMGNELAGQVSQAVYQHYLEDLLYTHQGHSRGRVGAQRELARDNIFATMAAQGLSVELHPFVYNGTTFYNVIATKRGTLYPERVIVLGAHFDSLNNAGADDNASGVAGVMELARVIAPYDTAYTIRFCAWDMEEAGLRGSTAYVAEHRDEAIVAMIQLDMIASDNGANAQDLYGTPTAAALKNELAAAFPLYGNGLGVQLNPGASFSDHHPFDQAGYPAVVFVEDNFQSNSCYHNQCDHVDTPGYIDYPFAVNLVRVVAGYLADKAVVMRPNDCDRNDESDRAQIDGDPRLDCNGNGVLDSCEPGAIRDCDGNGVSDLCDVAEGRARDTDGNGVLDACQTTRRVPSQYATIQAAIDASGPGDVVLVGPGTYTGAGNKDLDFGGRTITVKGEAGPAATTIDCQGSGRAARFRTGETSSSVLEGFTIRNGNVGSASGGGIACESASPTLRDLVITNCTASAGGGLWCSLRANPIVANCRILSNQATNGGAARLVNGCSPVFVNSIVADNRATSGGAFYLSNTSKPLIVNCTVARNASSQNGGALYMRLVNLPDLSSPTITNSIFWGNTAFTNPNQLYVGTSTTLAVYSSDVEGGLAEVDVFGAVTAWERCIDADPQFLAPLINDYRPLALSPVIDAGDNTLVIADIADLDGDGDFAERLSRDLSGTRRMADDPLTADSGVGGPPVVDMGAYELPVPCVGDVDGDNDVDTTDLAVVLVHFGLTGQTRPTGDLDGDGAVSLRDLSILLLDFGTRCN